MATVFTKDKKLATEGVTEVLSDSELSIDSIPALGAPVSEKQFWFQRTRARDVDAIATQPSVFDDVETAEKYHPRSDW
jgi:hypothetical protein